MKILFAPALALATIAAAPSAAIAPPASIAGDWTTADRKSVVRFYQCGEAMCGKIQRFLVPEPAGGARDGENPDKSKRDRKLLGLTIFWDLTPDGDDYEGRGYNPEDGRYFNAKVERLGTSRLKVGGCVAVILCRSQVWTKA